MSNNLFKRSALVFALLLSAVGGAQAALITSGFTFAVASGGSLATGTHFHSNTGGSFGNPAGKAEVGRYSSEEVRGLSEYNLTGLSSAASAFVTFDIFRAGGLFAGVNGTPFTGSVIVDAYAGNNTEDISDYQAVSIGSIGTFNVQSGVNVVGDIFSFNITSLYNSIVAGSGTSLGIRLRESTSNADFVLSKAWTFQNFRLTTDDQCTGAGCGTVPEPTSLALVALGMLGAAALRRRG